MREIKFRAWDDESNLMIYSDFRNAKLYNAYYAFETDSKGQLKCSWETEWAESCTPDGGEFKNLMQYTGFKDDNGIEIYEGDILERIDSEKERFVIEFDNDKCGFMLDYYETDELYNFEELPDCRIIGNVYASFEQFKNELKAGEGNNEI